MPVNVGGSTATQLNYIIAARDAQFQRVVDRVSRRLERLERRGNRTTRSISRMSDTMNRQLAPVMASIIGSAGLAGLTREFLRAGLTAERLDQRFKFASGSLRAGAEDMRFVRAEAKRLGIDFVRAADGFTKFSAAARGTTIGRNQTREIFLGIAEASAVLRLSQEQVAGAFRAVEQVMSKGRVQAEELRGQLGERIPGAFQIAARAMNVTTAELNKMLELGQVASDDFLPKFGAQLRKEFARGVPDAIKASQASFARLQNAIVKLGQSIGRDVNKPLADMANILTKIVGKLQQLQEVGDPGRLRQQAIDSLRARGLPVNDITVTQEVGRRGRTTSSLDLVGRHPTIAPLPNNQMLNPNQRAINAAYERVNQKLAEAARAQERLARLQAAAYREQIQREQEIVDLHQQEIQDEERRLAELSRKRDEDFRNELMREQEIFDLHNREVEEEKRRLDEITKQREDAAERQRQIEALQFMRTQQNLSSIVGNFIKASNNIGEALHGVLSALSSAIIDQFANKIAEAILGSAAGSFFGAVLGGGVFGFQRGGAVQRGRAILVGEGGPEVFVPRTSGHIIPNHAAAAPMSGPVVNLTFNIASTDGPGVRAALREAEPRLTSAALSAVAVHQSRPGSVLARQSRGV